MKKLFILLIIFISTIGLYSKSKSVVDYFNTFPGNDNSKIFYKNDKWIYSGEVYGEMSDITVDLRNGFIEYEIGGGDGLYKHQFVLFKDRKKNPYIGKSVIVSDGGTRIRFYDVNRSWKDVTKSVLPEINESLFYGKLYKGSLWNEVEQSLLRVVKNKSDHIKNLNDVISFEYYLPQYGTEIIVKTSFKHIDAFIGYSEFTKEEIKKLDRLKKKSKPVKLKWSKNKSKFYINK